MFLNPFKFVQTVGLVMLLVIGATKFHLGPSDAKKVYEISSVYVAKFIDTAQHHLEGAKMPNL